MSQKNEARMSTGLQDQMKSNYRIVQPRLDYWILHTCEMDYRNNEIHESTATRVLPYFMIRSATVVQGGPVAQTSKQAKKEPKGLFTS